MEILADGTWGSLCVDGLGDAEARVICRQLNNRDGVAFPGGAYGAGGQVVFNKLQCSGEETQIQDCVVGVPPLFLSTSCPKASAVRCYETG